MRSRMREFGLEMNQQAITDVQRKIMLGGALAFVFIFAAACGGSLYKVKPVVEAPVVADGAAGAEAGGLTVRAVPLLTDEESYELFESNLLLAGLLPVRVEMNNNGGAAVDFKKARFRLRDGEGREWKTRSAKDAVSRILKANDVFLYNPNSRAKFEEDFRAHALNMETPLAQGERRRGLVFFEAPKKEAISSPRGLVLSIEKLPQPLSLRLN
jgi:hypothetical protein